MPTATTWWRKPIWSPTTAHCLPGRTPNVTAAGKQHRTSSSVLTQTLWRSAMQAEHCLAPLAHSVWHLALQAWHDADEASAAQSPWQVRP